MTVSLTSTNQAISVAPIDLITSALIEAGILSPGDTPDGDLTQWCLEKLQRLMDTLNAIRPMIFAHSFGQFTLTANHSPHTIGPSGDFQLAARPVEIVSAAFILNASTTPVDSPIKVVGPQWWAQNPVKTLTSAICTHLYYDPQTPLGQANFWPVCTLANPVRLEYWTPLPQAINASTKMAIAQGYWELIITSLAIRLIPGFPGRSASPELVAAQQGALRAVLANNNPPPEIRTDQGTPDSGPPGRPDFNFLTGLRD